MQINRVLLIISEIFKLSERIFAMTTKLTICLVLSISVLFLTGCKTKEEKAASKALISAEQGAALAQYKLGKMYATGEGVAKDMIYAYMWVNFSDIQGLGEKASEYKSELAKQMTAPQIEEAEKLSTICKEKGYKDC